MSEPLAGQRCTACRPESPRVEGTERDELLAHLPGWKIVSVDGIDRLVRVFKLENFAKALAFANAVGAAAEAEDHHPALLVEWGKVTVSWWTHAIRGLHKNDFVMAAKTDALAPASTGSPPASA